MNSIKAKKLHPEAKLPSRAHSGDAGLDLYAIEDKFIPVGGTAKIATGIAVDVPYGYYAQIHDRSSMAAKGLRTGAGVVDTGYHGELAVVMHNLSNTSVRANGESSDPNKNYIYCSGNNFVGYHIKAGDKIAQLVIHKIELPAVKEVDSFEASERGINGFGSSDT